MADKKRQKKRSQRWKTLRAVTAATAIFILAFAVLIVGAFVIFAKDLPDPARIDDRLVAQSTKIYDREGETILYNIHGEERRTVIPLSDIPEHVQRAAIAIEDQNFYRHPGVDIRAIVRAFWVNVRGGNIQGGSTITQQFIKNSILSPERTITRKIQEAILAVELERRYEKNEILEFYLNQIAYGSNAYGIEAAALTFFEKGAQDLTLAEAALLSALPRAPTYYSPYGSRLNELIARQHHVLDRMAALGFISRQEAEEAKREELVFGRAQTSINAPHFVFYVREFLEERYDPEFIAQAGLRVITTLDQELQRHAEGVVRERARQNESLGAFNAGLVALDPRSGEILAMVGSRDFFMDPLPSGCTPGRNCMFEPHVNVTLSNRQPGSAFKPFVYAAAFAKGYTDNTVVFDVPTEFSALCSSNSTPLVPGAICYHPRNYDGQFRGPVTLRTALASSLNVPSVKLLYLAGVADSIETAQRMGITTLQNRERFGLALVLGGGEVKLLDITSAFGVFANDGIRNDPIGILRIEDSEGNVIEEFASDPTRVIAAEDARLVSDVLSDNEARTATFGPRSVLHFDNRNVAVKTGTTNEFRDGWTIGYTPSLVVGVWTGNNNNAAMRAPGASVAAPIWRETLTGAFNILSLPNESFVSPAPREANKPMLNGQHLVDGQMRTILYYLSRNDPLGSPPTQRDPLFNNWDVAVRTWAASRIPSPDPEEPDNGAQEDQESTAPEDSDPGFELIPPEEL